MNLNVRRIISAATLLTSLIAIFLVLKKPQPVAHAQAAAAAAVNAQSFQDKLQQLDRAKQPGQAAAEVHLSSDEVSAAMAQSADAIPVAQVHPAHHLPLRRSRSRPVGPRSKIIR